MLCYLSIYFAIMSEDVAANRLLLPPVFQRGCFVTIMRSFVFIFLIKNEFDFSF